MGYQQPPQGNYGHQSYQQPSYQQPGYDQGYQGYPPNQGYGNQSFPGQQPPPSGWL